ncbi:ABC transporter ATP-binding protein [Gracilibacillus phocaeensis]|uniref:ABC transporter ATP-binding protein n=1 Tax=Gracilibacillus phocaeensis TaxID=2042304 RepID=UPI0010314A41|nr:ABC transporter ATP-binding protein [Gracilibacillus phocaeensis]
MELRNVRYQTGETRILKGIDLELEKGKIYGLLGPNGVGKTTLFKALLNTIDYQGDILPEVDQLKIGKLIEYPAFYPQLTCEENLQLHASYLKITASEAGIDDLLEMVDLVNAQTKKFKELSMGMKQRLGVAKALMGDPDLLLLDEPTNGLDPMGMKELRQLIEQEIKTESRIILISSHHLNEVALVADTLIFMRQGEKILELENSDKEYIYGPVPSQSNAIANEMTILADKKNRQYFLLNKAAYHRMTANDEGTYENTEKLTLEDVYIRLMSSDLVEVNPNDEADKE